MQFLIAFVGGVTGGAFVLLGAWFSDLRSEHHRRVRRILELAAAIESHAHMAHDCVMEVQVRLHFVRGPSAGPATLDLARFNAHEGELARLTPELTWLTFGTELAMRSNSVVIAVKELAGRWGSSRSEHKPYDDAMTAALVAFDDEVARLAQMGSREQRKYLRTSRSSR